MSVFKIKSEEAYLSLRPRALICPAESFSVVNKTSQSLKSILQLSDTIRIPGSDFPAQVSEVDSFLFRSNELHRSRIHGLPAIEVSFRLTRQILDFYLEKSLVKMKGDTKRLCEKRGSESLRAFFVKNFISRDLEKITLIAGVAGFFASPSICQMTGAAVLANHTTQVEHPLRFAFSDHRLHGPNLYRKNIDVTKCYTFFLT